MRMEHRKTESEGGEVLVILTGVSGATANPKPELHAIADREEEEGP
jgi:hypothetical protein